MKHKAHDVVLGAMLAAVLLAAKELFAVLPNIELVSLFLILYTVVLGWRSLVIVAVFVAVEGLLYGMGTWWFCYLYVWPLLVLIVLPLRKLDSPLLWAVISGVYGLLFGALCSFTYLVIGGPAYAFSYWTSGIPFDLLHCGGNFAVCLVLFRPLKKLLLRIHTGQNGSPMG